MKYELWTKFYALSSPNMYDAPIFLPNLNTWSTYLSFSSLKYKFVRPFFSFFHFFPFYFCWPNGTNCFYLSKLAIDFCTKLISLPLKLKVLFVDNKLKKQTLKFFEMNKQNKVELVGQESCVASRPAIFQILFEHCQS